MEYLIKGRKPERFFNYFEEISAIPRGSGNEKGIADYIVDFANKRGLYCYRDEVNNVFVRMPASAGRENEGAVMLQGHTDMVCEKNADVVHDFEKDGIKLVLNGDLLTADGTTLGADNGVAVAMMLAILDGELESHPAIECLFTVSEEVGLDGAKAFDYSVAKAEKMLNLDSEGEGMATVSCAGGVRSDIVLKADKCDCSGKKAIEISISGLSGGHSGADIHTGKANANKLMGRVLCAILEKSEIAIAEINGGSKDNAIPRECSAVIVLDGAEVEMAKSIVSEQLCQIKKEVNEDDAEIAIEAKLLGDADKCFSYELSRKVIAFVNSVANGVLAMSNDIKDLVEFSRNLGVIRTSDEGIELILSTRSSTESLLDSSERELALLSGMMGGEIRHHGRYPGWKYEKDSELRVKYIDAARKILGLEPQILAIHAGLECGIIKSHINNMDIISIGPEMRGIHTPDEVLDLASCERFWLLIEEMLKP